MWDLVRAQGVVSVGECMVELSAMETGSARVHFGGDTANTACYLAALAPALNVSFATAVGTDRLSDRMLEVLGGYGVRTENILKDPVRHPGLYAITTDDSGDREFLYWRSDSAARHWLESTDDETLAGVIGAGGAVFVSLVSFAILNDDHREHLFRAISTHATSVVFSANYRRELWSPVSSARQWFDRLGERADLVFASSADLAALFETTDPDEIASALRGLAANEMVMTSGSSPTTVHQGGQVESIPIPPPDNVADTTGAGDAFAAGYIAARANGADPLMAARSGHRIASIVVGETGALCDPDLVRAAAV